MWVSNGSNNFAPFAGYMLKRVRVQRAQRASVEETPKPSQKQTQSKRESSSHHERLDSSRFINALARS